jgi:predicted transcriptional regulator
MAIHSQSRREPADDGNIDGGYVDAVERLREILVRQADEETTLAIVAIVREAYGYTPAEIREQLGLSRAEMRSISLRLENGAKALRAES